MQVRVGKKRMQREKEQMKNGGRKEGTRMEEERKGQVYEKGLCLSKLEGGGGRGWFRIGNICTPVADSCQCMAKLIQYCKVISLQLK